MNRKKTVKSIEITEKTIKTTLKRAILSEGANINKDEFTKKNIPSIKSKIFIACLMLTMVVFSGCNNLTSSVSPTFNKNETEKKNPAYEENISLNEYYCSENGYSLVFYRYDADKQEVDLIFDSNCLVKLYDVYYDDSFNGDKNIEYYTGYVDKNEKNQFEIIYDRVANQYSVFAGIGGEKIYFDQKWYTGNYVFNQAKTTNHSQIELLTPSSYSFQMNSYGEPSTATDFGEYSHDTVFNIIPNSFELYGRMSLDKTSYVGTHGDVPFDPYRLSVTLKTKKDNIYFIQKIYMDVLVFDEYGETIKEYQN